jgi:hypothetical protein
MLLKVAELNTIKSEDQATILNAIKVTTLTTNFPDVHVDLRESR